MSKEAIVSSADQLPIVPEEQLIEPIVQCGVLYLGSASPSLGRRGVESVQEPFAHRYPVDGTNTVQGIDAILSVYDNGMQLAFARQPHTVIFFPISSLLYCASLRFSTVEWDQTSSIDWRFVTLDTTVKGQTNHPPLFCAVVQRTQILPGDECHCFITKSDDAALALVRTISEVYSNLKNNVKPYKSPIFYQLDRYGRKITETSGVIYIEPDKHQESRSNKITERDNSIYSNDRNYLLDPSRNGFFYRTDASVIETWQLWDDVDSNESRPHPPASPFGLHQGVYHDDLTHEVHKHLSHMDDEEQSNSCSCSTSSSTSSQYDRHHHYRRCRSHSSKRHSKHNIDQLNASTTQIQASSFDPTSPVLINMTDMNRLQKQPIVIEKVIPTSIMTTPQPLPTYAFQQPQPTFNYQVPMEQPTMDYAPMYDSYFINERGEKITPEGNRILYMDVIQSKSPDSHIESQANINPTVHPQQRKHGKKRSKHVPVLDRQAVENIIQENKPKLQRKNMRHIKNDLSDDYLTTSDMLEMVNDYFGDCESPKNKTKNDAAQIGFDHSKLSMIEEDLEKIDSKHKTYRRHRRRSHSKLIGGPPLNYVQTSSIETGHQPTWNSLQQSNPFPMNSEQVNDYVTNIYGTFEQGFQPVKSPAPSKNYYSTQTINTSNPTPISNNQDFISAFRYMQSSVNPLVLREYHKALSGV